MRDQEKASPSTRSLFYPIMRIFASDNPTKSVLLMRLVQSLLASGIFGLLIYFGNRKMRMAVVASWALTSVPIVISTLPQTTPRSWAYLSGMSSWAFLTLALERRSNLQKSRTLWLLFGFSCFLAIASRWDATLFVAFTSVLVITIHLLKNKVLNPRMLLLLFGASALVMVIARSIFSRLAAYTTFDFGSVFSSGKSIFQVIHIPENVADGFGLGVRLVDLGPDLIGLIGLVLFTFVLTRTLTNANAYQVFAVVSILLFIFLAMFQITLRWTEQIGPSGVYVVQLLAALLGLAIALSVDEQEFLDRTSNQTLIISLLTVSHALALHARMEWAVRPNDELNDTYSNLSLDGGWWWNVAVGPNIIYILGALAFPAWLIVAFRSIPKIKSASS